jgi:tetratricopeptide (TPR) repeat protein
MVAKHKGEDVREQLDALYKRTGDLIDLKNLVHHLFCVRDWTSLRPLLEELFRREPTIENARRVVACLYHRRDVEAAEIVAFLQQNADLVQRDDDLTSTKAWALFYEGRLQEAREVQKELVKRRRHVNDLSLDINLTIQSGDWDGFAVIVDQEWPGRDTLDPKLLLRLGALAGEVGQRDRAITFATLAVEKAPNDPHILVGAYALAVDLGREGVSEIDWLARAAELSSEAGPVRKVDLRLVMEDMLPAATERSRKVDRKLTEGEIPIHLAASLLKTPMSRAFFELPHLNEIERDARRLTLIPIVSGARGRVEAKQEWTIGLDITSVFVLFGLGLLEKAFGAFRRVLLPTATMELLLNERRLARFHQPSRIAAAEQVRAFIDAGRLKVLSQPPAAPQRLVEEVGRDLAELLETARRDGGRVVRPQPIHRPGTYLEKESDLGDEARRFVSTVALARALMEAGHLERERYERAVRYLGKVDLSPEQPSDPTLLNQPLYIDDLALIHLQTAGLFEVVCTSAGQVSVHPSFQEEIVALISARRQGERLAQKLDDLRAALRDSVADGRVGFLPWRLRDDDETGDLLTEAPTLARLLQDFGPCDAICVDDRFANHTMTIADQKGRTLPLLCVLDILHHMATTGVINRQAHLTALHTLRRKGFILIPIEPDELEERLRDSSYDPSTKQLSERIELRTLRQSLAKVRSLALIRQPRETLFLDRLRISSVVTLYRLWQDPVLLTDRVEALTDWVWNHLAPSPLNWAHTIEDSDKVMAPEEAFALHLSMLLQLLWGLKRERSEALCKWIESQVLGPLLPTNPVLLDRVTDRIKWEIDRLVEESSHDTA